MAYVELIGAMYYGIIAAIITPADNLGSKLLCKGAPIILCAMLAADALSRLGYLK
jgi:hypothetical protein